MQRGDTDRVTGLSDMFRAREAIPPTGESLSPFGFRRQPRRRRTVLALKRLPAPLLRLWGRAAALGAAVQAAPDGLHPGFVGGTVPRT